MATLLKFDDKQVDLLIDTFITAYRKKELLYAKYHQSFDIAPQSANIPFGIEFGSEKHIRILFLLTLITLQSSSDVGFANGVRMYEKYPYCFECNLHIFEKKERRIVKIQNKQIVMFADSFSEYEEFETKSHLEWVFKEMGLNKPAPWSKYWIDCVRTLFEEYDGNPLAVIEDVKTVDGFLAKKSQKKKEGKEWWFRGYGEKLFSLFCLFCEELKVISPVWDAFPVDVHVQRIFLGTEAVTSNTNRISDTLIASKIRRFIIQHDFIQESLVRVDLAHAYWFNGSKVCKNCPKIYGIEDVCPVQHLCKGSPATNPYWKRGRWELDVPWNTKGKLKNLI